MDLEFDIVKGCYGRDEYRPICISADGTRISGPVLCHKDMGPRFRMASIIQWQKMKDGKQNNLREIEPGHFRLLSF